MFPPTVTVKPAASRIRPVSAVVVDFPFVPVIAITRPSSHREASSSSPTIGTPRSRAPANGRLVRRHAGTQHDEIRRGERLGLVSAELERHAGRAQRAGVGHVGSRLRKRHVRAPARQQLRGGDAASRGSDDRHALTLH